MKTQIDNFYKVDMNKYNASELEMLSRDTTISDDILETKTFYDVSFYHKSPTMEKSNMFCSITSILADSAEHALDMAVFNNSKNGLYPWYRKGDTIEYQIKKNKRYERRVAVRVAVNDEVL